MLIILSVAVCLPIRSITGTRKMKLLLKTEETIIEKNEENVSQESYV